MLTLTSSISAQSLRQPFDSTLPLTKVTLPAHSPRTMTDDELSDMIGTFNRYAFVILDCEDTSTRRTKRIGRIRTARVLVHTFAAGAVALVCFAALGALFLRVLKLPLR